MDISLISTFLLISVSNEGKMLCHSKFLQDHTKLTNQSKEKKKKVKQMYFILFVVYYLWIHFSISQLFNQTYHPLI